MHIKEGVVYGENHAELYFQTYEPDVTAKAIVIVLHGLGDHSGGLSNIIYRLIMAHYKVYAFDLRGHGRSSGKRGFVKTWTDYRGDLHAIRKLASQEHPDLPLLLVAHSLGGLISLDYALHHGDGLSGMVVISPAIAFEVKSSHKLLIYLMNVIKPDYSVEHKGNFTQLNDSANVKLEKDALRHNLVTPGMGRAMLYIIPQIRQRAGELKVPVLLQYGLEDKITSPEKLRAFFKHMGSQDKQKREYEGAGHRPFDESGRERCLNDMVKWIENHLK